MSFWFFAVGHTVGTVEHRAVESFYGRNKGVFVHNVAVYKARDIQIHQRRRSMSSLSQPVQEDTSTYPKGFLDPKSVPNKVKGFDVQDGEMCKNASWQPLAAQIVLPPLSADDNMMRKKNQDQTVHFPPSFGGKEKEHLPLEERKKTVNSTKFAMRLVRGSRHHEMLKELDDAICYSVARAAIESGKPPFKKDDDVHAIREKITCILKDNNPEEYAPVAEMVIKKVPDINHKDQKFSLGYVTKKYNTDGRRMLKIDKKKPTFGWSNLEDFLKKGAAVHHAFGFLDYASLFVKNKKLDSCTFSSAAVCDAGSG